MATVFTTGDNNFATAKWIVNKTAGLGTHTSIAAALTSASSGDTIFIMPNTYTENLTLKAGVNLSAYPCDADVAFGNSPNVIILGKATATFAGTCALSGICLKTNSDFCLVVSGSSATDVELTSCFIMADNNTAVSFTSSSGSSKIELLNCRGNINTTLIAYFAHSGAGAIKIWGGIYENDGLSTTASTVSGSGSLSLYDVNFINSITTSSTGYFTLNNANFVGALIANSTAIAGDHSINNSNIAANKAAVFLLEQVRQLLLHYLQYQVLILMQLQGPEHFNIPNWHLQDHRAQLIPPLKQFYLVLHFKKLLHKYLQAAEPIRQRPE